MARSLNLRGFRRIADMVSMPREVQAATKLGGTLFKKSDDLVRAATPAAVEAVIGEAWHETVADLAFSRDPYVALRSVASFPITAATDLVPASFDFFDEQSAATNVAAVSHNLLDDNHVLKPALIHNIGIDLFAMIKDIDLATLFASTIDISRDKTTIFEVPLMSCVKSLVLADPAQTAGSLPSMAIGEQASAGLEIEGHGIPMAQKDNISVDLKFPDSATFSAHATEAGMILFHLLMDGEVMDE